jgi:hypothetical protein
MTTTTITDRQERILALLSKAKAPMGTQDILAAFDFGRQSIDGAATAAALDMLIAAQLVDKSEARSKRSLINAAGRAALIEHKRLRNLPKHSRAPASRDNLFDRAPYVPHAQAYYRNSGNSHIASHGAGC